jgi:hypothetical protein
VWYLSYGRDKNVIIIYVDFFLLLGFERHAPSYHLIKKVWWCSTTTRLSPCPLFLLPTWKEEENATTAATDSS